MFEITTSGGSATFKLTPKGETLTIVIGEEKGVDLNSDGRADVFIEVEEVQDEAEESGSVIPWIVLVVVLLLILGGVYWYFKGKKN